MIAVAGASFQIGWNVSVLNVPVIEIKNFFNESYTSRYGEVMSESTETIIWSITNGMVPFGGIFGGLTSGLLADRFGRYEI